MSFCNMIIWLWLRVDKTLFVQSDNIILITSYFKTMNLIKIYSKECTCVCCDTIKCYGKGCINFNVTWHDIYVSLRGRQVFLELQEMRCQSTLLYALISNLERLKYNDTKPVVGWKLKFHILLFWYEIYKYTFALN